MIRHISAIGGRTARLTGLATATVLLVSACAPNGGGQGSISGQGASGSENPLGHVHGLSVDPGTDNLMLATHYGVFDLSGDEPEQIGPVNDYMGFAVAGPDHYYASGHPGEDSDLPNPMGLIESTDGGETWQELSRQGESDFHAMAVSSEGVIGFDGTLRLTPDGQEWSEVDEQIQPAHLAASPQDPVVLATTEPGVQRSIDGGRTWELPEGAPVLLVTGFADADTAVGVDPEGAVHVSRDAGLTWEETGGQTAQPAAVAADVVDGGLRIWVATEEGVESSEDGGASFSTTVPVAE
ncbi:MAG: F510_1955 family glycosylhydrolase [Brachybacterium sp.]|uniref:F510_1955 family glycosylhydrolase n=1 Tax=Brachybacterium sp. TaxID=1891286 RepID=UPI003242E44A